MKKSLVSQAVISKCLLEDHLILTPPRVADIKTQLSKHEVTNRILEPIDFETIAADVVAWKQFMNESTGPT